MAFDFAKTKIAGVGMMELIIALAIVSTMATIAIPPFNQYIESSRLKNTVSEFQTSLAMARAEATAKNKKITLGAFNQNWTNGWIVFDDTNNNGIHDNTETRTYYNNQLAKGVTAYNPDLKLYFVFSSSGFISNFKADKTGNALDNQKDVMRVIFCSGSKSAIIAINETGTTINTTGTCP